jgi:hypothetical protein
MCVFSCWTEPRQIISEANEGRNLQILECADFGGALDFPLDFFAQLAKMANR